MSSETNKKRISLAHWGEAYWFIEAEKIIYEEGTLSGPTRVLEGDTLIKHSTPKQTLEYIKNERNAFSQPETRVYVSGLQQ